MCRLAKLIPKIGIKIDINSRLQANLEFLPKHPSYSPKKAERLLLQFSISSIAVCFTWPAARWYAWIVHTVRWTGIGKFERGGATWFGVHRMHTRQQKPIVSKFSVTFSRIVQRFLPTFDSLLLQWFLVFLLCLNFSSFALTKKIYRFLAKYFLLLLLWSKRCQNFFAVKSLLETSFKNQKHIHILRSSVNRECTAIEKQPFSLSIKAYIWYYQVGSSLIRPHDQDRSHSRTRLAEFASSKSALNFSGCFALQTVSCDSYRSNDNRPPLDQKRIFKKKKTRLKKKTISSALSNGEAVLAMIFLFFFLNDNGHWLRPLRGSYWPRCILDADCVHDEATVHCCFFYAK